MLTFRCWVQKNDFKYLNKPFEIDQITGSSEDAQKKPLMLWLPERLTKVRGSHCDRATETPLNQNQTKPENPYHEYQ